MKNKKLVLEIKVEFEITEKELKLLFK